MSIEHAMVSGLQQNLLNRRMDALLQREVIKGCSHDIAAAPVDLEPPYVPIGYANDRAIEADWVYASPPSPDDLVCLKVWSPKELECDWKRAERFVKQLFGMCYRSAFYIVGNKEKVQICFVCHRYDEPVLRTAFQTEMVSCALGEPETGPIVFDIENNPCFHDYVPPPPYSHLLTRPPEHDMSPLEPFVNALLALSGDMCGFYQVLIQPVAPNHNWHHNVETLIDWEFYAKLKASGGVSQRFSQQIPSGDLRNLAMDAETKSHNDKPFFAVALRVGLFGDDRQMNDAHLRSLSVFTSMFQHGGRPLEWLTDDDYRVHVNDESLQEMVALGTAYRPGFLLNSSELAGLIHVPPLAELSGDAELFDYLDTLEPEYSILSEGAYLGMAKDMDATRPICIPDKFRLRHTHIIGCPGLYIDCFHERRRFHPDNISANTNKHFTNIKLGKIILF